MTIELCEDNGFLNNGVPSLVVLVVTTDDGRKVRIPYHADKTIQELYADVSKMNIGNAVLKPISLMPTPATIASMMPQNPKCTNEWHTMTAVEYGKKYGAYPRSCPVCRGFQSVQKNMTVIEHEDIIKCVKVIPRDEGTDADLIPEVDREYRVISIYRTKGKNPTVLYYEVLDDTLNNKIRMPVFAEEVELSRKAEPQPPRLTPDKIRDIQRDKSDDQLAELGVTNDGSNEGQSTEVEG